MKSKSFKRVTAAVLGLSMVGTGMLANMGGIGLFEDFSLTADAAETQTVTLHFYESTTSKLKDVEVPLDTEYTFKSPGDLFSTQIPAEYRFKYWKLSGSDKTYKADDTIRMTQEYYQQNSNPYYSMLSAVYDSPVVISYTDGFTGRIKGVDKNTYYPGDEFTFPALSDFSDFTQSDSTGEKQFKGWSVSYNNEIYPVGAKITIPENTTAMSVSSVWSYVQSDPNHTHDNTAYQKWVNTDYLPTNAGKYYLNGDVTLSSTYVVDADISICLNGHTISLENGKTGSVIKVNRDKTLTIYDEGGGTIEGGNTEHFGGGIDVEGTLILNGGEITKNKGGTGRSDGGISEISCKNGKCQHSRE